MLPVLVYGKAPTLKPALNGAKPATLVPPESRGGNPLLNNRELSVTHMAATDFATTTTEQRQADNRAQMFKMVGAVALILLGFYLLDKKG